MAGIVRTIVDYATDEITTEEYIEGLYDPNNETELMVLGGGLLATSIIGTIWVGSKLIKGGAAVHRFLKR